MVPGEPCEGGRVAFSDRRERPEQHFRLTTEPVEVGADEEGVGSRSLDGDGHDEPPMGQPGGRWRRAQRRLVIECLNRELHQVDSAPPAGRHPSWCSARARRFRHAPVKHPTAGT